MISSIDIAAFEAAQQEEPLMTVTVYSKPDCPQCDATKRSLDAKGISYETVDLAQSATAMDKVMALGHRSAPVVISGDLHWSGFRPDLIAKLATPKLTKAQQSIMALIAKHGHYRCIGGYRPAKKLIELGLVDVSEDRYGVLNLTKKA